MCMPRRFPVLLRPAPAIRRVRRLVPLVLAVLAASGCVRPRVELDERNMQVSDALAVDALVVGETTMDEVRERFGGPAAVREIEQDDVLVGMIWAYAWSQRPPSVPITATPQWRLALRFDAEGILQQKDYARPGAPGHERITDPATVERIRLGQSTADDVRSLLDPPLESEVTLEADGSVSTEWRYSWTRRPTIDPMTASPRWRLALGLDAGGVVVDRQYRQPPIDRNVRIADPVLVAAITPRETTLAEVYEVFGPPSASEVERDGDEVTATVWSYRWPEPAGTDPSAQPRWTMEVRFDNKLVVTDASAAQPEG